MDASRVLHALLPRQSQDSTGNAFLDTIQNQTENQTKIGGKAVVSSLILALSVGGAFTVLFCFLRPHNNVVYAPRAKYADSRHAPPPVTKGFFSWVTPLFKVKEPELVDRLGLDAAVFLRVYRMMRNMFLILAVIGCSIIIPVNVVAAKKSGWFDHLPSDGDQKALQMLNIMTPQYLYASQNLAWAFVVVAWLMSAIILSFLWWNYRAVARLRRQYFDSQEYRSSLHSRTLLITDIPKELRTDDGIVRITEETRASSEVPRAAIARNVKDLPDLVEEHEDAVKKLEKVLAKYLKNPDKLPLNRPLCKPSSKDKSYSKGQKVDAIEYLTTRIKQLEIEIGHVRESVDKRNALPFGFASYQEISEAHIVAYTTRSKAPRGAEIRLAPRPNDLIWRNLKMLRAERKWQNFINGLWIALMTVLYVVPNILIAVFLANLGNLALFWPAFQRSLDANQTFWGVVQGVLSPAISFLIYLFLPMVFRKLRINAGDLSKTSRERHVTSALYSFFVFNQFVVISFFSVAWGYIALIVKHKDLTKDNLGATIVNQLSTMSPYWVSWMIQRNMGASIDLIQLLRLTYGSFQRRFMSPTPREQIEASAPQPFDYASYYNVILFYSTVAFVLAPIQPLVLLIAAANFCFDSYVKKYMLLYIFITKYESGGMFWRTIFNRVLVLTVLGNLMIAIIIVSMGFFTANWPKLAALAPVFLIIIAFKFYCVKAFDDKIHFYQQGKSLMDSDFEAGGERKHSARRDKVSVRFGNPVLYKPLITPMVSAKSQHLLKDIYSGRTSLDMNPTHTGGYSDVYMDSMDARHPGKGAQLPNAPFEIVNENEMDFEHFKNRAEFREAAGGDGQLFGHGADMIRPGTPSSIGTGFTRTGTMDSLSFAKGGPGGHLRGESDSSSVAGGPRYPAGGPYSHARNDSRASSSSRGSDATRVAPGLGPHAADGTEYPRGYHQTPSALREQSPAGSDFGGARSGSRGFAPELGRQQSQDPLVMRAAAMGHSEYPPAQPYGPQPTPPHGGYGPIRYGGVPTDSPGQTPPGAAGDETSYDYFRRGRSGLR